jgi:hypothetical protein
MERLQQLINQLQEQYERKVDPSQMLQTIRLMEAELAFLSTQAATSKSTAKVAVMMPSSMKIYTGQAAMQELATAATAAQVSSVSSVTEKLPPAPEVRLAPDPGYPPRPAVAAVKEAEKGPGAAVREPERGTGVAAVKGPEIGSAAAAVKEPEKVPAAAVKEPERGPWPYDPLADIPTFAHQQKPRELNDVIGNNSASLNDRLRSDRLELKSALNDTPVRDLKKAIGVNDRFVFINQLFRGDEAMYERSLKTINSFRILPEAEYWMERELKVKLGWNENSEATKHFYQLVKRRFS